jgi:hypothetical protein
VAGLPSQDFGAPALIVAREGDRVGTGRLFEHEIAIRPCDLRVRVVDPKGTPMIGVPVALHKRRLDGRPFAEVHTTAPDGLAEVRTFWMDFDLEHPIQVVFGWPLDSGEPLVLHRPLPREPVTLVLRETAAIHVIAREPDGGVPQAGITQPWFEDYEESQLHEPADGAHDPLTFRYDWPHAIGLVRGEAIIPYVAIGTKLHLRTEVPGWAPDVRQVQTPAKTGETVVVDVLLNRPPAYTGRIVEANGAPFRGVNCMIASWENRPDYAFESRADADGRFRYPFPTWPADRESWLTFAVEEGPSGEAARLHGHRVKVSRKIGYGDHDLGDVRFDTNDVIVEGSVLAPDGRPLAGATVEVSAAEGEASGEWMGPFDPVLRTDERGRFLLTGGYEGATRFRVDVYGDLIARVECARGARNVVVQTSALATATVRLEVDPALGPHELLAEWTAGGEPTAVMRLERSAPGLFGRTLPLRPGTYSVAIRAGELSDPLVTVQSVELRPGEALADPRLDIDLRARLKTARLNISLEAKGAAVDAVRQTAGGFRRLPVIGNRPTPCAAVLIVDGRPATVVVRGDGLRAATLEGVTSDREVRLRGGLEVKATIADLPEGVKMTAWPEETEDGLPDASYGESGYDTASGTVTFTVEHPGRHRLRVTSKLGVFYAFPDPFTVDDLPSQDVHLRFDRVAFDRARATAESRASEGR